MLLAAVSACHKLWYLHLCADAGICVTAYTDHAEAVMDEGGGGSAGRFVSAVLKPRVTIAAGNDRAKALELHHEAHRLCFIANSVNFPIECRAEIESGEVV